MGAQLVNGQKRWLTVTAVCVLKALFDLHYSWSIISCRNGRLANQGKWLRSQPNMLKAG
jgi:hypothetical protein